MKLKEAATIPGGENCLPTFKVLAAAGTNDFKKNKVIHRAGAKLNLVTVKGFLSPRGKNVTTGIVLEAKRREAGRPKLKCAQRKPVLLRQVSSQAKQRLKQAAAIIRRCKQSSDYLTEPCTCTMSCTCIHIHSTYIKIIGEREIHGQVHNNIM